MALSQSALLEVLDALKAGESVEMIRDAVQVILHELSRICADLDVEVVSFADRDLSGTEFPYLFLDATYCKARIGGGKGGKGSRSRPRPSWSRRAFPLTGEGKSSASASVTVRTGRSGPTRSSSVGDAAHLGARSRTEYRGSSLESFDASKA